jgi:hypothetical protein
MIIFLGFLLARAVGGVENSSVLEDERWPRWEEQFETGAFPNDSSVLTHPVLSNRILICLL